jgi:hypothetical protein
MIRLNLKREPYWIDLPANVKLYVRPLSTAIMSAAQSKVIKEVAKLKEKDLNETKQLGLTESLLIKALAQIAIIKWKGVLEANNDQVADVTDQNVDDLMDIWFIAQEFWKAYTDSLALLEAEGKSLVPGVNGTLGEGPVTARRAKMKSSPVAKVKKIS